MDDMFIPGLQRWTKPNVRKIFLPDPDHVLFEVDLKQSDAQVVAWDADDPIMKQMFREGVDLHTENAKMIYACATPSPHQRQMAKHGVHATDFLVTPKTMAKKLDMTIQQATNFQKRWFDIHPWIPKWHRKLEMIAMKTRTSTNAFGYRRIFFDRIQSIMPEIIAFIPQSTTERHRQDHESYRRRSASRNTRRNTRSTTLTTSTRQHRRTIPCFALANDSSSN